MTTAHAPAAKAEMLIRKPVAEVFEAFIDPEITSKFWFTKGGGRLVAGTQVSWTWEMYHFSMNIKVLSVEQNKRILIEWPAEGPSTTVEWIFTSRRDHTTFISITNSGFAGTPEEIMAQVVGSTEGFSLVLAGLKALLEHHVVLNLVADRFPDGIGEH